MRKVDDKLTKDAKSREQQQEEEEEEQRHLSSFPVSLAAKVQDVRCWKTEQS